MKLFQFVYILGVLDTVASVKLYCDDECHFKEPLITVETIKSWPTSCKRVCGDVILKSGDNLTEAELKSTFINLKTLMGNLIIDNTTFESLDFLPRSLRFNSESSAEITIRFNKNLIDVKVIDLWTADGPFVWNFYQNPKLNFEKYCNRDLGTWNMDLNVYGNLKNCDCESVRINSKSLPYYPNCTLINGHAYNGLIISDVKSETDLYGLLNLKKLNGRLEIYETKLSNLSFLENLETIDMNSSSADNNVIDIHDNPKLKRFGLVSLKKLIPGRGNLRISIPWNHPDLCITIDEFQLFIDNEVEIFSDPVVKICEDLDQKNSEKVCKLVDLKELDMGCQHIIGDVVVDSKNEINAWKLENVTNVYGSITVQNTEKIKDLSFLSSLEQVAATLDQKNPLIRINSNKKFETVSLPSLKRLYPYPNDQIIEIKNNDLEIFNSTAECRLFQKEANYLVMYNGKKCEKISEKKKAEGKNAVGFQNSRSAGCILVLFMLTFI